MTENDITKDVLDSSILPLKEGFVRFVNHYQESPLCASASLREADNN